MLRRCGVSSTSLNEDSDSDRNSPSMCPWRYFSLLLMFLDALGDFFMLIIIAVPPITWFHPLRGLRSSWTTQLTPTVLH